MLSRIASSLFWIGRYIERSDGTARILDVHLQLLLEDPWIDEDTACRSLLGVMGSEAPEDASWSRATTCSRILAVDRSAAGIHRLLAERRARERPPRARDRLAPSCGSASTPPAPGCRGGSPATRCTSSSPGCATAPALAVGIIESCASRDEAWQLLHPRPQPRARGHDGAAARDPVAHRGERAELDDHPALAAARTRRTCAPTAGCRRARNAAEFLLLDRLFPRSHPVLGDARGRAVPARHRAAADRVGVTDQAQRLLGQIRSELEYRPIAEILDDLPAHMDSVQEATSAATEAIRQRYFPTNAAPSWIGDNA